jgi:hypothetical protein
VVFLGLPHPHDKRKWDHHCRLSFADEQGLAISPNDNTLRDDNSVLVRGLKQAAHGGQARGDVKHLPRPSQAWSFSTRHDFGKRAASKWESFYGLSLGRLLVCWPWCLLSFPRGHLVRGVPVDLSSWWRGQPPPPPVSRWGARAWGWAVRGGLRVVTQAPGCPGFPPVPPSVHPCSTGDCKTLTVRGSPTSGNGWAQG